MVQPLRYDIIEIFEYTGQETIFEHNLSLEEAQEIYGKYKHGVTYCSGSYMYYLEIRESSKT